VVEHSQNNHKNALTQRLASHQHLIEKVSDPEKEGRDGESSSVGDLIAFAQLLRSSREKDIIFARLSPEALKFYDTKFSTAY